jgi:hypothetical protein
MRRILLVSTLMLLAGCGEKAAASKTDGNRTAGPNAQMAAAAGVPPLDASGVPRIRLGLWEVAHTGGDKDGATTRECVGEESSAALRDMLRAPTPPGCKLTRSTGPDGLRLATACVQAGVKVDTLFVLRGSETHYTMEFGTNVVTSDGAKSGGVERADARWVGACPAGVTPGQG